ncbi:MAG: Rid family hydrolase [Pseudochelatococcus sp.]|jgi:enamine deaminase RidA (YjgF/YER057c/UK114 family)|uniref:Rid family hydrolase n=1 Tax=Pseudochelatococcus sp. TaxID=2020869 RepID=UPI003D9470E8
MTTPQITKLNSGSPMETRDSYSRLVVVDNWIFGSLTAGRNYQTRELSPDPAEQARQCIANIKGALEAVGSGLADVVRANIVIPSREDIPVVLPVVAEAFRGIDPANVLTCAPLSLADFKVEIDITAYRGAGAAPQQRLKVTL